jgi:hypothetical protein
MFYSRAGGRRARSEMTMPERECEILHSAATGAPCRRPATTVARLHEGPTYFCAEHGREWGARPIEPVAEARAEGEERAHDRVAPEAMFDSIAAVNLYVEAFVAGAKFAAAGRGNWTDWRGGRPMTEATLRLRFLLVTLAAIAQDLARGGYRDGVAWRGLPQAGRG